MNFQCIPKKHKQSESFVNYIKECGMIDISEAWLTLDAALLLYLNEASFLQPKKRLEVIEI